MSSLITVYDDLTTINSLIGALTLKVSEVFVLYRNNQAPSQKIKANIESVLNDHKMSVAFIEINHNDEIDNYINENTVIDLSTTRYLSLVLFEKAVNKKNRIVYFDTEENLLKDYREHKTVTQDSYRMTIDEIIRIKGGRVFSSLHKPVDDNDEVTKDLIIKTVENSIDNYTGFVSFMSKLNSIINASQKLNRLSYKLTDDVLVTLNSQEMFRKYLNLDIYELNGNVITFKSEKFIEMMGVTGTFLEDYLYIKLNDSRLFDEVRMSVKIDFSDINSDYKVECEIDCIVLKNNRILFTSCKSNKVSPMTLMEIATHNYVFGNELSAAVVATIEDLSDQSPSIYLKGKELGVAVIDETSFRSNQLVDDFISIIDKTYIYER